LWWTKGFDIADCLQQDVVQLLQEALELNMVRFIEFGIFKDYLFLAIRLLVFIFQ
jgi:hypothetical protein